MRGHDATLCGKAMVRNLQNIPLQHLCLIGTADVERLASLPRVADLDP